MHRVTHCIRRIAPAEVPTVTPLDGSAPRPMNEQELVNIGVVRVRGDIYSCAVQEQSEDGRTWTGPQLPGVELSRGKLNERFRQLPAAVRAQLLNARVERTTGAGAKRKTETITVRESEIQPGDVVKEQGLPPHMWAGERDR